MPIFLGLLCGAASLVLTGTVAWLNYRFMSRLGASEADGLVLGVASIAVDVMLALLPALIAWAWLNGRRLYTWGASGLVLCFAVVSFASALGAVAEGRDAMLANHGTQRMAVAAVERKLERLEAQRKSLGTPRLASVIEAELSGWRTDRRWHATQGCTFIPASATEWCKLPHGLEVERASADEAERIDGALQVVNAEVLALRQQSARGLLDAQVDFISEITGWAEAKVRMGLVLLVVFALLLGAGFGLGLGLVPLLVRLEEKKRLALSKPPTGQHLTWADQTATVEEGEKGDSQEAAGTEVASRSRSRKRSSARQRGSAEPNGADKRS